MSRHLNWSFLLVVLLSVSGPSQNPKAPAKTPRAGLGYVGDVHSSLTTREHLTDDPRTPGERHLAPVYTFDWIVFDRSGRMIESGEVQNGKPFNVSRYQLDAQGGDISDGPGGHFENKYEVLSNGTSTFETYSNGQLQGRTVWSSESDGRRVIGRGYDASGHLTDVNTKEFDAAGRIVRINIFGREHEFLLDSRNTYDSDGNLVSRSQYDEHGHLLINVTVDKNAQVTSFWSAPDFKDPGFFVGFPVPFKKNVNYSVRNGSLEIIVQNHEGRDSNLENDDEERTDSGGNLLEKIVMTYDRDSTGNWTSRTTSVWDPKTGATIAIERDTRTLTYY